MDQPEKPVKPHFEKAADLTMGWREQQWYAMSERQQKEYERLEREHRQRRKEKQNQFWKERAALIEQEKRKLLLEKPELALRMLPGRLKERRAAAIAAKNVQARHEQEVKHMDAAKQKALDDYMAQKQEEREKQEQKAIQRALQESFKDRTREKDRGNEGRSL